MTTVRCADCVHFSHFEGKPCCVKYCELWAGKGVDGKKTYLPGARMPVRPEWERKCFQFKLEDWKMTFGEYDGEV